MTTLPKRIAAWCLAALACLLLTGATTVVVFVQPATVACSTALSTIPADVLKEGFEGIGYEAGMTDGGGTDPNEDADTSAIFSAVTGACSQGLYVLVNNANIYAIRDHGSNITLAEQAVDHTFYLYVDSEAMPNGELFVLLQASSASATGSGVSAYVILKDEGGQLKIYANATSASTMVNLSLDTVYKVKLHLDPTGANSYLQINDGDQNTFTRAAAVTVWRYTLLGAAGSATNAGDDAELYFDLLCIDTP